MTATTKKPSPMQFMPAPRPTKRLSPEDAEKLNDASADLGFARPMSDAGKPATTQTSKLANVHLIGTEASDMEVEKASGKTRNPKTVAVAGAAKARAPIDHFGNAQPLRLDVPQDLWLDLKVSAAKRRVSVRWLVLEALQKAGYNISIDEIPEDGRRVRNLG